MAAGGRVSYDHMTGYWTNSDGTTAPPCPLECSTSGGGSTAAWGQPIRPREPIRGSGEVWVRDGCGYMDAERAGGDAGRLVDGRGAFGGGARHLSPLEIILLT